MEQYRKLIQKFTCELGMHSQHDGFQSAQLREKIFSQLRILKLPPLVPGTNMHPQMDEISRCRLDYLTQARKIGESAAQSMLREELPVQMASHYLYGMILAGAGYMGREIARNYAIELFPELERLRQQNIELLVTLQEPEMGRSPKYGFIVETNPYFTDVGEIQEMETEAAWEITHDELGETYRETFTFDSPESAEKHHSLWEMYRDSDITKAPVEYAINVSTDQNGKTVIGEITHVKVPSRAVWEDKELSSRTLIFPCLGDAINQRRLLEEEAIYGKPDQNMRDPDFEEVKGKEFDMAEKPAESSIQIMDQKAPAPIISK